MLVLLQGKKMIRPLHEEEPHFLPYGEGKIADIVRDYVASTTCYSRLDKLESFSHFDDFDVLTKKVYVWVNPLNQYTLNISYFHRGVFYEIFVRHQGKEITSIIPAAYSHLDVAKKSGLLVCCFRKNGDFYKAFRFEDRALQITMSRHREALDNLAKKVLTQALKQDVSRAQREIETSLGTGPSI